MLTQVGSAGSHGRPIKVMAELRADQLLVARGLFESRAKAQEAIEAGLVLAGGIPIRKPADRIDADCVIEAKAPYPWVSRGGVKLAHALDVFGLDPNGCNCLDVGASTGGFSDVLLTRGARRVVAVDTGHAQLHARLKTDARVLSLEATDIRHVDPYNIEAPFDLATVDVSFIPLRLVLPTVAGLLKPGGRLVALVKPQFEAGRAHLKKGIVRDDAVHEAVCQDIEAQLTDLSFDLIGRIASPIAGGDGNREFLIGAVKRAG